MKFGKEREKDKGFASGIKDEKYSQKHPIDGVIREIIGDLDAQVRGEPYKTAREAGKKFCRNGPEIKFVNPFAGSSSNHKKTEERANGSYNQGEGKGVIRGLLSLIAIGFTVLGLAYGIPKIKEHYKSRKQETQIIRTYERVFPVFQTEIKNSNSSIPEKTEKNLENITYSILRDTGNKYPYMSRVNKHFQAERHIWVAGEYFVIGGGMVGGFVYYSPDNGNTWTKQWLSDISFNPNKGYDIPIDINFSNSEEGWLLMRNGVLHTNNRSNTWNWVCRNNDWYLEQLHVIDKQKIVLKNSSKKHDKMLYTSDGGDNWNTYLEWKPEILNLGINPENLNKRDAFGYNKISFH